MRPPLLHYGNDPVIRWVSIVAMLVAFVSLFMHAGCENPRPTVTVVQFSPTGEVIGRWSYCRGVWVTSDGVNFRTDVGAYVQITGQYQIIEEKGVEK